MLDFFKNIMGGGSNADFSDLIDNKGAIIIDVRSKGEYQGGHLKNSINISLRDLESNLSKLKKDKPIITCCASGARSASAKSILISNGFSEVYNGGAWQNLQKYER